MYKGFYKSLFVILIMFSAVLAKGQNNLAVTNILYPTTTLNCTNAPRTDSVVVRVANISGAAITNFDISYSLNGGSVVTETYTGTSIATSGSINYTFATKLNTLTGGVNTLKVYTSLPGDPTRANDTAVLTYVPKVSSFPYFESFENNNGGFTAGGTNSTWIWGARNKPNTGQSADGARSWTNGGLTGLYANSDVSYLTSPCYDFTNLKTPYIAFQFVVEVEYSWEVVTMQYSTNGGSSWSNLGSNADADNCETKNWYNLGGWSGNARSYPCGSWGSGCGGRGYCGGWAEAKRCLNMLAGQPSVMFRWAFTSTGSQCTAEGFALDSLVIGEAPALNPLSVTAPDTICQNAPAFFNTSLSSCYKNPRWDFGDGTPVLRTMVAAHAFKNDGTYKVAFMVDGLCGKVDTVFKQITILPAPPTIITGLSNKICQSGSAVTLTGTPTGGTFYVDGTQQNTIDPSTFSLGRHYVVYKYTDTALGGCTATDTVDFTIYMPTASIDNLGGQYCPAAPSFKLKGTPAGGIFTINGVQDSVFNPATLGLGTHTVIYAYTDSIGCPASDTKNSDVNNTLVVTLGGMNSVYCAGEPEIVLTGTPTGGIFYVNGVVNTKYDPAALAARAGIDTVVYYYSDGACANADTATVDVIKNNPNITGLNAVYCYDAATVSLTANPTGGIFTLDGNPVFSINPKTIATGAHRLVYTYQDPTYSCIDSAVGIFTIDKPTANITGLNATYCIDAAQVTLTATPAGGNFTLDNTAATQFTPATTGLGTHRVIYTYTNANNCSTKDTQDFVVVGLPNPQIVGLTKNLCFNSNPISITTNPTGGAITINGLPVSGNTFDPSIYTAGKHHVIEYTFVDFVYGCVNKVKDSVFVGTPPPVAINGLNTQYCSSDDLIQLSGTPTGGQFTVNGTNTNSFNPKTLGAGSYTVKYSYTDVNGCYNEIDQLVDVITNPGDTIFPGPVINICRGEKVTLTVSGSLPGMWSTNETTPTITVQPSTNASYWFKVTDCANYADTVQILVNNNPDADFDFTPQQGFVPLDIIATNKTPNISSFKWIVEGKESVDNPLKHTFETPGQFKVTLTVVNDKGCVDTVEKIVTVYEGITIPNVFSPEGDGVNDNFGAITKGTFTQYSFKIFDRWGKLMFEGSRPEDRWNGDFNGNPAPAGTYFYLLVAENLKQFKLEGTVTLVR
ncbi:MAG: gliding motility-associated C-terminal domain-containing protein [Bacteroidota bacterium]